MCFKYPLAGLLAVCLMISCNNSADTERPRADSGVVVADSAGGVAAARPPNAEESNDFSDLPGDSLKFAYGSTADKLYGYRSHDTLHVDGDMLFTYPPQGAKGVITTRHLWIVANDSIELPYVIDRDCKKGVNIDSAFIMWDTALKVRFFRRTNEKDYIRFVHSDNTQSFVGRSVNGKGQTIELADDAYKGSIAHEIGHALGLFHEQMRSDRDIYVKIVNCKSDTNYKKAFVGNPYVIDVDDYNYFSIMHYSRSICMIILKDEGLPPTIPGQRDSVTLEDYATIRKVYHLK